MRLLITRYYLKFVIRWRVIFKSDGCRIEERENICDSQFLKWQATEDCFRLWDSLLLIQIWLKLVFYKQRSTNLFYIGLFGYLKQFWNGIFKKKRFKKFGAIFVTDSRYLKILSLSPLKFCLLQALEWKVAKFSSFLNVLAVFSDNFSSKLLC